MVWLRGSPPATEDSRVTLSGDPLAAFSRLRDLLRKAEPRIDQRVLSLDYRDRSVGHWVLEGVRAGASDGSFTAERAHFGPITWDNPSFGLTTKAHAVEVRIGGADADAIPRATAKYLSGDERAAEWIITVPNQPFAAFGDDASRISGTLSWVVPSDPKLPPRGGFRFVLDPWQKPPWPEASALTGSSGSVSAVVVPAADGPNLRLERVEVAAALFTLEGSGSVTSAGQPAVRFQAKGRRTCSELGQHLAPSRYRDAVRKKLEAGVELGWVELELTAEVSLAGGGSTRLRWHLAPGCGLSELGE